VLLASSPLIGHQIAAPVAEPNVLPGRPAHSPGACQVCTAVAELRRWRFENYEGTRPYSLPFGCGAESLHAAVVSEKELGKVFE